MDNNYKFKAGDKVKLLVNLSKLWTIGSIFTIKKPLNYTEDTLLYEFFETSYVIRDKTDFELVEKAEYYEHIYTKIVFRKITNISGVAVATTFGSEYIKGELVSDLLPFDNKAWKKVYLEKDEDVFFPNKTNTKLKGAEMQPYENKTEDVKTQFNKRLKYTVIVYNENEVKSSESKYFKSLQKAKIFRNKYLQNNPGHKVVISKEISATTTDIPLVKAK